MEASTGTGLARPRELPGDKASRIVDAMRTSVADRGIAGATFDHVARMAGVSRGLLHYYFGTKERLLVEAVRRETEVQLERLELGLRDADSADEVLTALARQFEDYLEEGPAPVVMVFEMATVAQRNAEIAAEVTELGRLTRLHVAAALQEKAEAGALQLRGDAEAVTTFLFAVADGISFRRLIEPDLDLVPVIEQSVAVARKLLS
jgi:AcrR family transcriptional regulator